MDSVNTPAGAAKAFAQITEHLRRTAGLERKEATLADGTRYVYLEAGSGEPLVLLHGFGSNKDHFCRVAKELSGPSGHQWRIIIPDHIGFGESTHSPSLSGAPSSQARRLNELCQQLGMSRVHVGGSSMGGHIAMTWATLFPDMVASLWLLNPGGVWSAPASEMRQRIRDTGRNLLVAHNVDEFRELMSMVVFQPVAATDAMLAAMGAERFANVELEQQIFKELGSEPIEERVKGLTTPTLIVWGKHDRVIHPDSAAILHGLLPNSQVILLDDIGHVPAMECPARVAEDYLRFRASL